MRETVRMDTFLVNIFPFYGIEGYPLAGLLESPLYWRQFVCGEEAKHKAE